MRVRDGVSFVAFGVLIAVAVVYIGNLGVRLGPPSKRTNLSMTVSNINGLEVDSNVLLRGVGVGKVTNINTTIDGATVDFYIKDGYRVPVDSEVRLDNLSALGETYIGLFPRSEDGPMLRDGQHIATQRVKQPPSISELATSVVRVLNQMDPDALKRVVAEADIALPAPISVLPNLSHASILLRNTAADMGGRGEVLLENMQVLLRNAGFLAPVLATLAQPGPPGAAFTGELLQGAYPNLRALADVGADNIKRFKAFMDRIQALLDNNGGDLKVLGEAFLPHLQGIAGALLNIDSSQILANILARLPEDGAITLHVAVPQK